MVQRRDGLVVRIQIKNERGEVVGEADAVAFKGLLSLAHEEGLEEVVTQLVQVPTEENGRTAIVTSRVVTRKGVFTGIGDANPQNTNRRIVPHIIRMAETRATARALRLAVNIGEVAIEELGDDASIKNTQAQAPRRTERHDEPEGNERGDAWEPPANDTSTSSSNAERPPERFRGRDRTPTQVEPGDRRAMSDEQRKLLFRLAYDLGATRETARDVVLKALGCERLEWAERPQASRAIDALKREVAANAGNGDAAPHERLNGEAPHGPS